MKGFNKDTLLLLILICLLFDSNAQDEIPLEVHHKIYAKGGSIVVGNTILGKHKSKPFDSEKTSNDVIDMMYVDVDADSETFSSSSANIDVPEGTTRILYAAIYWSGLYPSEESTMRLGKRRAYYKKKGGRQEAIDSIKVKWGDKEYIDIKGEIVFNAKAKGKFKKDSPYICRADITEYLNSSNNNFGNFTAANIRAVRGKLEGGSAAGWHLYIVYENPSDSPKYFTIFDGFRQVAKDPVEITFNDFKTKTAGDITSTLVMATLEGDIKIKSDQCAIFNATEDKFITLQTPNREGTNFFKSSITIYSEMFLDRNPPSKNTLGFDLLKMKLADDLIANNANQATIRFKSKADRFYLYFTAFETEIEESLLLEKNNQTPLAEITPIVDQENVFIEEQKIVDTISEENEAIEELTPQLNTTIKEMFNETDVVLSTETITTSIKKENAIRKSTFEGVEAAYYLITNVFSKEHLAENWTQFLLNEGYNPQQFANPENGWIYIYILKTDSLIEIKEKRAELRLFDVFKNAWIIEINQ